MTGNLYETIDKVDKSIFIDAYKHYCYYIHKNLAQIRCKYNITYLLKHTTVQVFTLVQQYYVLPRERQHAVQ
jgi:hypothetical protein